MGESKWGSAWICPWQQAPNAPGHACAHRHQSKAQRWGWPHCTHPTMHRGHASFCLSYQSSRVPVIHQIPEQLAQHPLQQGVELIHFCLPKQRVLGSILLLGFLATHSGCCSSSISFPHFLHLILNIPSWLLGAFPVAPSLKAALNTSVSLCHRVHPLVLSG